MLVTDFPGKGPGSIAYHVPCHLRAQNMGFKTRDVLQLIPGTKISLVERCTAMDGASSTTTRSARRWTPTTR